LKQKILLWFPVVVMIAAAALIALSFIGLHWQDMPSFALGCSVIAVMLSAVGSFMIAGRLQAEKLKTKKFGSAWAIFISTATCSAIVIIASTVANMTRQFAFQVEPWQIYTYFVVIAVGEEAYYRLMLCQGIVMLLSSRNRVAGIAGASLVTIFAFIGGFQASTVSRVTFLGISVVIFTAFILILGANDRPPSPLASIVGVIVSGSTFTLCHWKVYANYPEMLVALAVGGTAMAAFLIVTKNPFVPFTAHLLNNLRALQGIIIN